MAFDRIRERNLALDLALFSNIFLNMMLCVSVVIWIFWLVDIFKRRHPIPFQSRDAKIWHPLIVVVTLLMVGFMLAPSAVSVGYKILESAEISYSKTTEKTGTDAEPNDDSQKENNPQQKKQNNTNLLTFNLLLHLCSLFILAMTFVVYTENNFEAYGFHKSSIGSQIADGCLGFVVSLTPVTLTMLYIVEPLKSEEDLHAMLQMVMKGMEPSNFILLFFSVVIVAPLAEELLYRVFLQGFLQDRIKPVFAIISTSIMFGFSHNWPDMFGIFALSLVLGYVFYRTNSYLTVFIIHALFNTFNLFGQLLLD